MKICVTGARGRMGGRILALAAMAPDIEITGALECYERAGVELTVGMDTGRPITINVSSDPRAALSASDVLIDFTLPEACLPNLEAAAALGKAAVIGTTGLDDAQKNALKTFAKRIPLVYAPNMSLGVNLLFKLTREIAQALGPDFNVEIVEIHHNRKKDSPSGTAVRLAECAADALKLDYASDTMHGRQGIVGERPSNQLGMHAVRGGDVTGDHTVYFLGQGERIELTHRAHSRDTFAQGALRAARYAVSAQPGLYDMQDVLGIR